MFGGTERRQSVPRIGVWMPVGLPVQMLFAKSRSDVDGVLEHRELNGYIGRDEHTPARLLQHLPNFSQSAAALLRGPDEKGNPWQVRTLTSRIGRQLGQCVAILRANSLC